MSLGYVHKIRLTTIDHETFCILNDILHNITANKGRIIDRRDWDRYEFDITLPAQMAALPIINSDVNELFGITLDKFSKVHIVYNSSYHTSCGEVIYISKSPHDLVNSDIRAYLRNQQSLNNVKDLDLRECIKKRHNSDNDSGLDFPTLLKWRICYDSNDPEVISNRIDGAAVKIIKTTLSDPPIYRTVGFLNDPKVISQEKALQISKSYIDSIGAAVIKEFFSGTNIRKL